MNTRATSLTAWRSAHHTASVARKVVTIRKSGGFPHPRDAGALATTTWPVGQLADYLLELGPGTAPLLIREFADRYEAFLAGVQLTVRTLEYLEKHPEAAVYVGSTLLGAIVGTAIGRTREAALLGAGVALLIAGIAVSSQSTPQANPQPGIAT